jgi:hypothetical protein
MKIKPAICLLVISLIISACAPLKPLAPEITAAPPVATTAPAASQEITVYFMDENRFLAATEPYEVAVTRSVPAAADLPRAVLDQYFLGPNADEQAQGLKLHTSGFTGVRDLKIENGVASVYMAGTCANNGAAYSAAALIMKNLKQFPEVTVVKIYDEKDGTEDPASANDSIPYCLEP